MSEAAAVAGKRNSQHNGFTLVSSESEIWLISLKAAPGWRLYHSISFNASGKLKSYLAGSPGAESHKDSLLLMAFAASVAAAINPIILRFYAPQREPFVTARAALRLDRHGLGDRARIEFGHGSLP